MNKSIDITFKLILALIGFYLFSRFIIPLIVQYLSEKKKKNSEGAKSLDQMIREQEIILRRGMNQQIGQTANNKSENKNITLEDLLGRYKEISNKSHSENKEIDPIINLIENLQWGESQTTRTITIEAQTNYGVQIEASLINKIIKENFKLPFFQQLPNIETITHYFISYAIIKQFLQQDTALNIGKQFSKNQPLLNAEIIIKGAHILIVKNDLKENFNEKIYLNIVEGESPVFKKSLDSQNISISNTIFSLGENRTITPKYLIDKILAQSMLVLAIIPINIPEKINTQDALNLFKITNKDYLKIDEIKITYKKFAQICHPDKLIGEKLPKQLLDNANKNFIKVKNAFDLLKKEMKDS